MPPPGHDHIEDFRRQRTTVAATRSTCTVAAVKGRSIPQRAEKSQCYHCANGEEDTNTRSSSSLEAGGSASGRKAPSRHTTNSVPRPVAPYHERRAGDDWGIGFCPAAKRGPPTRRARAVTTRHLLSVEDRRAPPPTPPPPRRK